MQISLRSLTGATTTREVQPSDTVRCVKEFLASEYDISSLKLCCKGKVLEDSQTFESLGFVGGEVLIIAGKKIAKNNAPVVPVEAKTTAPAASVEAKTATPAPLEEAKSSTVATGASATTPSVTQSVSAPTSTVPAEPSETALEAHGVDASLIDSIVAMGFEDRAQVALALRAAYMNPDRAVEYLCTGIPPSVLTQIQSRPPPQPSHQVTQEQLSAALGQTSQPQVSTALRQALGQIPQFEQIRGVVRQNPSSLSTVMQQLQQHHPQVFQLVQANPQEFLSIMNETSPTTGSSSGQNPSSSAVARQLQPTDADAEPIQRLVAIGNGMWDERAATIVYLICQRNEEVAANVLFDNGGLPAELAAAVMDGGIPEGDFADEESEGES